MIFVTKFPDSVVEGVLRQVNAVTRASRVMLPAGGKLRSPHGLGLLNLMCTPVALTANCDVIGLQRVRDSQTSYEPHKLTLD